MPYHMAHVFSPNRFLSYFFVKSDWSDESDKSDYK